MHDGRQTTISTYKDTVHALYTKTCVEVSPNDDLCPIPYTASKVSLSETYCALIIVLHRLGV